MGRHRGNNITLTVALRGEPKFFDKVCEKAVKHEGSVAAYVMRVLTEHEIADEARERRLTHKSAS